MLATSVAPDSAAPKVLALIQARMGSTRLPCKSLLSLHGKPLIDWVVERVAISALIDKLVVAVPDTPDNDPLDFYLSAKGVRVFRGSENDVLDRFFQAAKAAGAREAGKGPCASSGETQEEAGTLVIRICADNPLIWGPELDTLVQYYKEHLCDYAYNHIPRGNLYPDGLGAEILSFSLLADLARKATLPAHREHCLSYIWDNADQYIIKTFDPADARLHRPEVKLDIDTFEDYRRLALLPLAPAMPPGDVVALFPQT